MRKTGEPLGLFYLDMFPREGKYNHFAQFGIIEGKLLPDGKYQRPVCALICNFPPPQPRTSRRSCRTTTWKRSSTSSATPCTPS